MLATTLARSAAAAGDTTANFADLDIPLWAWGALIGALVVMLVVDLLLVHRTAHVITIKEAAIESAVWISIGLLFGLVLFAWQGGQASGEYYAGFLIEKSLSIDNVFVWAVIFGYFAVPAMYQFRVLFWGIFGALALRLVFVVVGAALISRFFWLLIVFGLFLVVTGLKIIRHRDDEGDDARTTGLGLLRRVVPVSDELDGHKFFTRQGARRVATPLFAALVVIEITDVIFALDSVPAVLAVSHEPYLVFASNAFAILGLRALYFCLAALIMKFRFLKPALILILAFVGVKLLLLSVPPYLSVIGLENGKPIKIDTTMSLIAVVGALAAATVLSVIFPAKQQAKA